MASRRSRPGDGWTSARHVVALALPRSLDKTLTALGLPIEKDKAGQRLVRSLSKAHPKTGAYPELTPEILDRVVAYNRLDILALEAMHRQGLGALPAPEQAVWELDQRINARGIAIDIDFVQAAKRISDQAIGEVTEEFAGLTGRPHPASGAKNPGVAEGAQMGLAQS